MPPSLDPKAGCGGGGGATEAERDAYEAEPWLRGAIEGLSAPRGTFNKRTMIRDIRILKELFPPSPLPSSRPSSRQ